MPGQDAQFIATPLSTIKGVGEQTLAKLARLGLHNLYDLILNLPFRFEDRTYIRSVASNPEENVPCALLLTITGAPRIKAKVTEIAAQDHEGTRIKLLFFHVSRSPRKRALGVLVLREGHYLSYAVFTCKEHDHSVKSVGDSSMRRHAVLECVEKKSELLLTFLVRKAQNFEHPLLKIAFMDSDASSAHFNAV